MKKFDWDKFYDGEIIVRIKSKEEAINFSKSIKAYWTNMELLHKLIEDEFSCSSSGKAFIYMTPSDKTLHIGYSIDNKRVKDVVNWSDYMEQEEKVDSENMNKNIILNEAIKEFDWDKFNNGEIAIYFKSKKEIIDFTEKYKENGFLYEGVGNILKDFYDEYKLEKIFIYYTVPENKKHITFQISNHVSNLAMKNIIKIINWSDYMEQKLSWEDVEKKLAEAIKSESCKYRLPCGMCELKKELCRNI